MKILKIFLIIFLILTLMLGVGLFFSEKIMTNMLKDGNTKFENINFVLKKGEIEFSNFYLKGRDLGKGVAKIKVKRKGFLGAIPYINLSDMKLKNVKEDILFGENVEIDSYIKGLKKQDTVNIIQNNDTKTENYVIEKLDELNSIKNEIDKFINVDKKEEIQKLNDLKKDYLGIQELKRKSEKLREVKQLSENLVKEILEKREKIINKSNQILEKNEILLENLSNDLLDLENKLFLNSPENIDNYIFIDRGEKIIDFENKGLKLLNLIKDLRNLNFEIENIDINKGNIIMTNLTQDNMSINISNSFNAKVKNKENKYIMEYDFEEVNVLTSYGINEILSLITYNKSGLLDEKNIDLVSEISFSSNNFMKKSKTNLSDLIKEQLIEKSRESEEITYNEIINNYSGNLNTLDSISNELLVQVSILDKIQRDIRDLRGIIEIKEDTEISEKNGEENEAR